MVVRPMLPNIQWAVGFYCTCIRTGGVLNSTEVPLHADTDAVILLRQLKACPWVIIVGLYLPRHTSEVLETTLFSWKNNFIAWHFTGIKTTQN
jgi:hypothetical protein